jgi:adenylate cyclase
MRQQSILPSALMRGVYGLGIGALFSLFEAVSDLRWIGVFGSIGFLMGFLSRGLDYYLYNTRLRRQRFPVVLVIRSTIYLFLLAVCVALVFWIFSLLDRQMTAGELFQLSSLKVWLTEGKGMYSILYSFLALLGFQFVVLVIRLLGPTVVVNYLIGRYSQPIEEERIFMFMDLRSSTTIAERLGHMKWHQFLNDFFYDVARPIRRSRGEVYQYVGDEVVISWPKEVGIRKLNCINCFFSIYDLMNKRRAYYLENYGFEPIFKAGYHVGKVVVGEIGDYKREIVFHGDVVNTASRIQMECNVRNRRLLISSTLLEQLDLKRKYIREYIDTMVLRGKQEEIELYSLDPVS